MLHIRRSLTHGQYFRERGFKIGGWVRCADGEIGRVHTYPGGGVEGKVSVGIDGAAQFGSGRRRHIPMNELEPLSDLPDLSDVEAVDQWLRSSDLPALWRGGGVAQHFTVAMAAPQR